MLQIRWISILTCCSLPRCCSSVISPLFLTHYYMRKRFILQSNELIRILFFLNVIKFTPFNDSYCVSLFLSSSLKHDTRYYGRIKETKGSAIILLYDKQLSYIICFCVRLKCAVNRINVFI